MNHSMNAAENTLTSRVKDWVVDSVGSDASITSVQRLHGGTASSMHNVTLRNAQGIQNVVLRQIDNAEWLSEEPDAALHEAESLKIALSADIPTPEIIAWDETGSICGIPAVLMTKLAGTVDLQPVSRSHWLSGLAQTLTRIHAVEADGFKWNYFTYKELSALEIPSWSRHPELWPIAFDIVKGPRPHVKPCFIHRDYHPANVLWTGDRVSGVVDWANACRGPRGVDVGHCRVDLAQLFDVATADAFLCAYVSYAGEAFSYDPYWDLVAFMDILFGPPTVYSGWAAFGITGLTDEMMERRLDEYLLSLVKRVTG
ncbi:phosphotransferase family protein [Paenibacillus mendelii]|uniref:Phosphotransferase family protein n=1 Tax=Paenibacillus mendelii TaxID=206163 RepID=A0ABV6JGV7_9BACL|nr:aminoglycoside phosphotransferase family protein [Paenibacillus mendelii]MCQ6557553.1 aminoglycoside phosphotransferase family protein [Paenibacillus mendelii]